MSKIHILSSAKCPKCGGMMDISDNQEYAFQCEHCDEDFYTIEVREAILGLPLVKYPCQEVDYYIADKAEFSAIMGKYGVVGYWIENLGNGGMLGMTWPDFFPESESLQSLFEELDKLLPRRGKDKNEEEMAFEYKVRIPSLDTVIYMQDGDGSQLSEDDYNDGFNDYVDYEILSGKNAGDGGIYMYTNEGVSRWTDKIPEVISYALDIQGECPEYEIEKT